MNKCILILLTTLLCDYAYSDSIDINITSYHFDDSYYYNNKNYGIGYTYIIDDSYAVKAGYFKNSYNKDSLYLMSRLYTEKQGWTFGLNLGFVTGYDSIAVEQEVLVKREIEVEKFGDYTRTKYEVSSNTKNLDKFQLVALPTVSYKFDKYNSAVELAYMPRFGKNTYGFITLQYQFLIN